MGMHDGLWVMITGYASWVVDNEFLAHGLGKHHRLKRRLGSKKSAGTPRPKKPCRDPAQLGMGPEKFCGGGVRGAPAW